MSEILIFWGSYPMWDIDIVAVEYDSGIFIVITPSSFVIPPKPEPSMPTLQNGRTSFVSKFFTVKVTTCCEYENNATSDNSNVKKYLDIKI